CQATTGPIGGAGLETGLGVGDRPGDPVADGRVEAPGPLPAPVRSELGGRDGAAETAPRGTTPLTIPAEATAPTISTITARVTAGRRTARLSTSDVSLGIGHRRRRRDRRTGRPAPASPGAGADGCPRAPGSGPMEELR